jgi:hypothetical protein
LKLTEPGALAPFKVSARKHMFFSVLDKKATSARLAMAEKQEFTFRK